MSRLRRLDVDDLRILRILLHGGNLCDAAKANCVTQPAVTQRLRKMEWVFDESKIVKLGGRTLTLTDYGVRVAVMCSAALRILEDFLDEPMVPQQPTRNGSDPEPTSIRDMERPIPNPPRCA